MALLLLLAVFALSALLWSRLPERALALLVGGAAAGLALYQVLLSGNLVRPQGALVAGVLLASGALMVLARPVPRKGPPRRTPKKPLLRRKALPTPTEGEPVLPGYELLDRVGVGGMATVYRARRLEDGRIVALKIPQEKFVADAKFVRRFHREAELLKRLNHPNIIKVFDHNAQGVSHYIAMEFVDGQSLEAYLEEGRPPFEASTVVMRALADALRYIHSQGIIHRDIKPANVMIARGGPLLRDVRPENIKLMDFGIAVGKVLTRLTMAGARVGTPIYMSPEQAKGGKLDAKSDIYSLGLVFYEMVSGQTAFKGSYEAVVHQQVFQMPIPPRQINLEVPKPLNDLIMRMIDKEPTGRPTLNEVIDALDAGILEAGEQLDAPSQLVLAVGARRGVLRVLDVSGNMHQGVGQMGHAPGEFPAIPQGVAADVQGHLYAAVAEYRSEAAHGMIRKYDAAGRELFSFGGYGLGNGEFLQPVSLAVHRSGQLYVLDAETHVVQRFSLEGKYLGRFGGRGKGKGQFENPRAIVAGYNDCVYVLDYGNHQIQRFSLEGEFLSRYAFRVSKELPDLRPLDGVGADPWGAVYISDAQSRKVRRITPDGKAAQSYTLDTVHGEDTTAVLHLGVDHQGNLYAARAGGTLIQKFAPDGRLLAKIDAYAPISAMNVVVKEPVPQIERVG